MSKLSDSKFVRLLWKEKLWAKDAILKTTDGHVVTIHEFGEADDASDNFIGAQINVCGTFHNGNITFSNSRAELCNPGEILQVVIAPSPRLCKHDGELLPQLLLPVSKELKEFYDDMVAKSGTYSCADYIGSMDSCHRLRLVTRLMFERLERKHGELMQVHRDGDKNWNHTLYVMLFRTMGAPYNKIPFSTLAARVPYDIVSREKGSPELVEAMLLGASGLLQIREDHDDYIRRMRVNFTHLQAKYNIKPMHSGEWKLSGTLPNGFATLRIVQMASFLSRSEFVFDNVIKCRTSEDVRELFSAEASEYWNDKFGSLGMSLDPKRIGDDKKDVFGINLVVPLMFAYAEVMGEESLKDAAIDLTESIPSENNKIIKSWRKGSVQIANAFDSQAMIQLTNEYCSNKRCAECQFGKVQIQEKFNRV